MPRQRKTEPVGLFAQALSHHIDKLNVNLRILAHQCDSTYEHMRKLRVGDALPSPLMLKAVCNALGLDLREMQRCVVADHIRADYGTMPDIIAGKNPELARIEQMWPYLTEGQKQDVETMIAALVHRNAKTESSTPSRAEYSSRVLD